MSERMVEIACRGFCGLCGVILIVWISVVRPMLWPEADNSLTDIDAFGLLISAFGLAIAVGLIRLSKR